MILKLESHNLCEIVNMQNVWFYMKYKKQRNLLPLHCLAAFAAFTILLIVHPICCNQSFNALHQAEAGDEVWTFLLKCCRTLTVSR